MQENKFNAVLNFETNGRCGGQEPIITGDMPESESKPAQKETPPDPKELTPENLESWVQLRNEAAGVDPDIWREANKYCEYLSRYVKVVVELPPAK